MTQEGGHARAWDQLSQKDFDETTDTSGLAENLVHSYWILNGDVVEDLSYHRVRMEYPPYPSEDKFVYMVDNQFVTFTWLS